VAATVFTPYSSAKPYFQGTAPAGVAPLDVERLQSYTLYDEFYWLHPGAYKLVERGTDQDPVYIPTARGFIESINRFLAVDFRYTLTARRGTTSQQDALRLLIDPLFKRENFYTKFNNQRRHGLIRGDSIWHITADDTKPEGTRVSIHEVHPGSYFPITDIADPNRVVGCHLIDDYPDPDDPTKFVVRRQTYRRDTTNPAAPNVSSELTLWSPGKWDDRFLTEKDLEQRGVLKPLTVLPPAVTQIPVYHIRNTFDDANGFGASELRGIESVLAATQQGTTDQALTVALGGLGIWVTDSGPPRDADGNITAWQMSPAKVTEIAADANLDRKGQLGSVSPSVDHLNFLINNTQQGIGIPDIAAGRVDVAVAESGISLMLQLAPILKKNEEKEQAMLGTYDQMFFDLITMWLVSYEGYSASDALAVEMLSVVGEPLPINRATTIQEILDLATSVPPLITIQMAQDRLAELGYVFPAGAAQAVLEQAATMAANSDPFAARTGQELGNDQSNTGNGSGSVNGKPATASIGG